MLIQSKSYTFNPATKKITFQAANGQIIPPSLSSIASVTNCSNSNSKGERLIYLPEGGDGLSGTWDGTALTLTADTTGMSSNDSLKIFFEDFLPLQVTVTNDSGGSGNTNGSGGSGNIDNNTTRTVEADDSPITLALATSNNHFGDAKKTLSDIDKSLKTLLTTSVEEIEGSPGYGLFSPEGSAPDPLNPYGAALQTTLRDPIQLDQSVPAVIGGIDPTGAAQRARVGRDGGLQLTDGPTFSGSSTAVNSSPTGWIDTTGYQSIVVTFTTPFAGALRFQTTNDTASVGNVVANASGWPTTGAPAPAASLFNAATGASWVFPVTAKWFRPIISAALTSGSVSVNITLRAAPAVFIPFALTVGGVDLSATNRTLITDTVGYQAMVGALPVGFQVGTFNVSYGRFTQALTSQTAAQSNPSPLMIGGIDGANAARAALTDTRGALAVTPSPSTQAAQSQDELLYQILATLRTQCHYLYEIMTDSTGRSASDEPDTLIGEYMNQANQFKNFIN